jgi:hypothetical protein
MWDEWKGRATELELLANREHWKSKVTYIHVYKAAV